jgi:hypothetical protein
MGWTKFFQPILLSLGRQSLGEALKPHHTNHVCHGAIGMHALHTQKRREKKHEADE